MEEVVQLLGQWFNSVGVEKENHNITYNIFYVTLSEHDNHILLIKKILFLLIKFGIM